MGFLGLKMVGCTANAGAGAGVGGGKGGGPGTATPAGVGVGGGPGTTPDLGALGPWGVVGLDSAIFDGLGKGGDVLLVPLRGRGL